MSKPEAFPLAWPAGYPVTDHRQYSKFDCTMAEARDGIIAELRLLRATDILISTNVKPDNRGLIPASGRLIYDNPGVAVYFKFKGEDKVVACDKWRLLHENLRAVQNSINAIRSLERWGCSDIISRAMGGMKALPLNAGKSVDNWWQILEVRQEATMAVITSAYRRLAKFHHPDQRTGDQESFQQINEAYESAKIAKGVK